MSAVCVEVNVHESIQYAQRFPGAGPSDIIGITQTAWTISSFILTAAGGKTVFLYTNVLRLTCDK
jgi:hypothetical protein